MGGEDAIAFKQGQTLGPNIFGRRRGIHHLWCNASEVGNKFRNLDFGVNQVGFLVLNAIFKAGVEDRHFNDAGIVAECAGGFYVYGGEGCLADFTVVSQQLFRKQGGLALVFCGVGDHMYGIAFRILEQKEGLSQRVRLNMHKKA